MYINNETRLFSQLQNYGANKDNNFNKAKSMVALDNKEIYKQQDSINISTHSSKIAGCTAIGGLTVDKGTAANTTIYVNSATYDQILSYTTNNPNCKWEEMGFDDEKRWVVVNGQRFEYPLSEEEKEARRRFRENCDIVKVFEKEDKRRAKLKEKKKPVTNVSLNFDLNKKASINNLEMLKSNSKIKNLMKNDKVMKMLSDISAQNGGIGIQLGVN